MSLDRERPKKVADADLLKIIALNSDEVTVGPSLAEIAQATGLAHGPAQRRVQHFMREGLVERGYRGYTITQKATEKLGLKE